VYAVKCVKKMVKMPIPPHTPLRAQYTRLSGRIWIRPENSKSARIGGDGQSGRRVTEEAYAFLRTEVPDRT